MLCTFHRWGGLVFIAYVFLNWRVIRILPHWMRYFLSLSVSDSIRDIKGVVYLELSFSLIGEIRLDLQDELFIANYLIFLDGEIYLASRDKILLGIILLPLLVGFSLICRMWAFPITHVISLWGERTGLSFWASFRDLGVSLGLPLLWACRVGLRAYFSNPISSP